MRLVLLGGAAHPELVARIGTILGVAPGDRVIERFPDGEAHVALASPVRGADVFLVEPLAPAPEARLVELLLLADACRRAGAARVTGVLPYLAFARQDRRRREGEANGARLAADLLGTRLDRVLAVDVHGGAPEGLFGVPFDHLTAIRGLAAAVAGRAADAVVVAPDLGAAKRVEAVAAALGVPSAVVHKSRVSAREVTVRRLSGDAADRAAIVVDDMISTGGTIEAAVRTLREAGCRPGITVAATHAVLAGDARERLARLGLAELVVTDTLPVAPIPGVPLTIVSVAPLLAEAIRRVHGDAPLGDLLVAT